MDIQNQLDQIIKTLKSLTDFSERQEAFNTKQESFNTRVESKIDSLQEYNHQNDLQHNATHRLIMQSFEHIAELKDAKKEPWQK